MSRLKLSCIIVSCQDVPHYDAVHELKSADEYLSVTENCHQLTTIVIHVYEGVSLPITFSVADHSEEPVIRTRRGIVTAQSRDRNS